jgi:hypothetical protein
MPIAEPLRISSTSRFDEPGGVADGTRDSAIHNGKRDELNTGGTAKRGLLREP